MLVQDARHGLRLLRRQPGLTAAAILTLALATGAATAIFSVIESALIHPLPYPNPEQLVDISLAPRGWAPSLDDVRAWSAPESPLSRVAVERSVFPTRILEAGTAPERAESTNVSEQYFALYGVKPLLGRTFTADDTRPGAAGTIVLSHAYWRSRFAGDRDIVGKAVRFDGQLVTIVGVLEPGFGRTMPIWRALQMAADQQNRRGTGWSVIGRLREGIAPETATTWLSKVLPPDPVGREVTGAKMRSVLDDIRGDYRTSVVVITGAVAIVVLLACVNVAGLLLARGATRQSELAVRVAIGAGRGRLFRQLITESLVLSAIGGAAGILLAWLTLQFLVANIPIELPGDAPARISGVVLASTLAVVTVNGIVFGLLPAWRLSRTPTSEVLARAGRQSSAGLSRRAGQALIAIEIALAVVMLAGTGLMLRSFSRLLAVDLGFDPERYVMLRVEPLDQKSGDAAQFYPALVETIRRMPDVEAVGAIDFAPLVDGMSVTAARRPGGELQQMIQTQRIIPGAFEALGVPVRQGRTLDMRDTTAPSVVINEAAAKLFYPGEAAVGRQLQMARGETVEIAGVVGDARHSGPSDSAGPAIYRAFNPSATGAPGKFTVVVRPRAGARDLGERLRQAAESVGTPAIIDGVRAGTDGLSERLTRPRQRLVLLTLLGGLGLLLAMIGVLGTTWYAVGRRTREIGIRLALGARTDQVQRRVIAESAWPILIGAAAGLGGAVLTTSTIKTFLFNTSPTEPMTLALVVIALAAAAFLAAWIPARRAARVDPVAALRAE